MRLQNRKKEKKNVEKGSKRHKLEGNQRLGEVKLLNELFELFHTKEE